MGSPGKAVRLTRRTCRVWAVSAIVCAGGVAGKAPKPNERLVPQRCPRRFEGLLGTLEARDAEGPVAPCPKGHKELRNPRCLGP